ncbi:MAG TPA: hypothetical protein VGC22_09750 [Chitinophaga sp.]
MVGQSWVLCRTGYGNKYRISPELEDHIAQLGLQQSPPWYSFIGLMAPGVVLLYAALHR